LDAWKRGDAENAQKSAPAQIELFPLASARLWHKHSGPDMPRIINNIGSGLRLRRLDKISVISTPQSLLIEKECHE